MKEGEKGKTEAAPKLAEMQGDLKISSQEGVGTEVRVVLPMLEPAGAGGVR